MSKELVLLDLDDVVAANAEGFTQWSNANFGTNLVPGDYTEDFLSLWPDVDLAEVRRRARMFHESDAMASYGHIEEAAVTLRALSERYRFVGATSRRKASEKVTRTWVDVAYEGVIEDVIFAGIYDEPSGYGHHLRTKAEVYRRMKPKYVIDDQYKHCLAAAELGISVVMFGDYRWTQRQDLHPNITWCKDWPEVREYFDGRDN